MKKILLSLLILLIAGTAEAGRLDEITDRIIKEMALQGNVLSLRGEMRPVFNPAFKFDMNYSESDSFLSIYIEIDNSPAVNLKLRPFASQKYVTKISEEDPTVGDGKNILLDLRRSFILLDAFYKDKLKEKDRQIQDIKELKNAANAVLDIVDLILDEQWQSMGFKPDTQADIEELRGLAK